jgi:hypothetical protein
MTQRLAWLALVALLGGGAAHGCASESIAPAPVVVGSGGSDASGAGGAGGSGGAPVAKRQIAERNPYGDVAKSDNLLWDGDFEWLSSFADQYGWLTGGSAGISYALPKQVLGWKCRSGIKCAQLNAAKILVGVGVASQGHALATSVWVSGASPCASMVVALLADDANDFKIPAEQAEPVNGWCHYAATVPERKAAAWLYVANDGKTPVIVDDASVQPVAAKAAPSSAAPQFGHAEPIAPEVFGALKADIRAHLKPHPRPQSEVERKWRAQRRLEP